MDIISDFSENLAELLDERKISVEELAESVDIDPSEIYRYLRKDYLPKLSNVVKIADKYNYSVDYLLGLVHFPQNVSFKPTPPFAQRFKFILDDKGITRYRLSKESKISINRIDDWYNGKFLPSVDKAVSLAKHLDCSVDYLLGRES